MFISFWNCITNYRNDSNVIQSSPFFVLHQCPVLYYCSTYNSTFLTNPCKDIIIFLLYKWPVFSLNSLHKKAKCIGKIFGFCPISIEFLIFWALLTKQSLKKLVELEKYCTFCIILSFFSLLKPYHLNRKLGTSLRASLRIKPRINLPEFAFFFRTF